jgi:pyrroline-5-carboxylate reductase
VIVLAVKPQQLHSAVDSIKPHIRQPLVLSIAAGVRAQTIARWLGTVRIVRAMPNTPALIRAGITGAAALTAVSAEQKAVAEQILRAVGAVIWFADEAMLDPVTAVSGSNAAGGARARARRRRCASACHSDVRRRRATCG